MQIRQSGSDDTATVGSLVHRLLCELDPSHAESYDLEDYCNRSRAVLGLPDRAWAYIASDMDLDVGVIVLNECAAIYANGLFGEITELYVAPEFRSKGIAPQLIQAARDHGHVRGWTCLEVGAPPLPQWQRTLDFYLNSGFETVGPRLKLPL